MVKQLDVYLYGTHAATITRRHKSPYLEYLPEYVSLPDPAPISVLLPVTPGRHDPQRVDVFLENLLPDRADVRRKWASDAKLSSEDAFELLTVYGADVQGALQFYPVGTKPSRESRLRPLEAEEIGERIRQIRRDSSDWLERGNAESAFSLGGQQGKFALALTNGAWFEPSGEHPSTHIIKPGVENLPGSDITEHIIMKLACALGISVAETAIEHFDGEHALVVKRYDRTRSANKHIVRLHQEDLAQATGVRSVQKYEADGGPGYNDIFSVFETHMTLNEAREAKMRFVECMIFSFLVGHNDGHAKNYSILHLAHGVTRLAPFYDMNSVFPFLGEHIVRARQYQAFNQIGMPFTVHGARLIGDFQERHFQALALEAGLPRNFAQEYMRIFAKKCMPALNHIIDELPIALRNYTAVKNLPFVIHSQIQRFSEIFDDDLD